MKRRTQHNRFKAPNIRRRAQFERQELHCHECQKYVQFSLDMSLNGNHVLKCPNCNHEHCRVVRDGIITGDRWSRRNGPAIQVSPTYVTSTTTSTWVTCTSGSSTTSGSTFLYESWMNTTTYT